MAGASGIAVTGSKRGAHVACNLPYKIRVNLGFGASCHLALLPPMIRAVGALGQDGLIGRTIFAESE